MLVGAILWAKETLHLRRLAMPLNIVRSLFEVAVTFFFLAGVVRLPLATATTIMFTAPIFLTLLAFFVLREHVGPWRWAAVVAGFLGVVLIADPSTGLDPFMLLPLVAAVLTAGRDTLTRMIGAELPARSIALTTAVAVMMAGLTTAPLGEWVALDVALLGGLFVCALLLAVAYVLLVSAVRTGEVSFIAPFRYVSILLALVFGITVFGDTPSFSACLGGAVIVGSGLLIFHRERARSR